MASQSAQAGLRLSDRQGRALPTNRSASAAKRIKYKTSPVGIIVRPSIKPGCVIQRPNR